MAILAGFGREKLGFFRNHQERRQSVIIPIDLLRHVTILRATYPPPGR